MTNLVKAVEILEPLDRKYPDHPRVTHDLIHSYDFAPIAKRGVPAANKYAKIAPSAPHALHMPSHIYSMVGMWEESIASNQRAIAVTREGVAKNNPPGTHAGIVHATDFMAYAYLQLGEDAKAKALIEDMAGVKKIFGPQGPGAMGASAVPARYMLERQDWQGPRSCSP